MGEEETVLETEESISTLHLLALRLPAPSQPQDRTKPLALIPEWLPHHGTSCRRAGGENGGKSAVVSLPESTGDVRGTSARLA